MNYNILPVIAISASALAALLIMLLGDRVKPNIREGFTFAAAAVKATAVFLMVPAVLSGTKINITLLEIADGIDLEFRVDAIGLLFACIASSLWVITSLYSIGYMRGHGEKNQTGYFAAFAMCLCGTMGICFSANLLTFFIFYEILTVATYPLVVHYRDDKGKASGRKYLLYTLTSGQLFFAATVYIYAKCGSTDFVAGGFIGRRLGNSEALVCFLLMVCAGAVKAGVMPLHSWLPAAMVAPTPVSALLHAVAVVKAGAFCVIRVVCYTFGPELSKSCGGSTIMIYLAGATIIVSSLIAIQKTNLKARLAYSTVGQLSYIVLGVCLLTPYSVVGAMYHMVAHAFLKITLFMCAGAIFVTTHKADITEMRGLGYKMPATMSAFTLASLGIAGLPFLPAFLSKMNIIQGSLEAGRPEFIAVLIISALLSLTYLVPVSYIAFAKTDRNEAFDGVSLSIKNDASPAMLIPIIIAISAALILGIAPDFGADFLSLAKLAAGEILQGVQ